MDQYFYKKNVIVTGGLGFLGSNISRALARFGANVTIIDSVAVDSGANFHNIRDLPEIKIHECDLSLLRRDSSASLKQDLSNADYIFNIAGSCSHIGSMENPSFDLNNNLSAHIGLLEFLKTSAKLPKVVFTSTRQVYGSIKSLPVDETHPTVPIDVNGIHKLAAEQLHSLYTINFNIPTCVIRLTNCYGPRMGLKKQGFTSWIFNRAMQDLPINIYGPGEQLRDFTYVDDVVEALLLCAIQPACVGKIFNLSGETSSVFNFAKWVCEQTSSRSQILNTDFPNGIERIEIGDYRANSMAFQRLTGWRSRTNIKRGIASTYEFYKNNLKHYL